MLSPLADRLRPKTLDEFVGQEHLIGENGLLRKMIKADNLVSLILWGPPGTGKTSLAKVIANTTKSKFIMLSAVSSGINDVKKIIADALKQGDALQMASQQSETILFIDEIHRYSKLQQSIFLPYVENGTIILIGATTENPSFEVIGPLLSRSKVLVLHKLSEQQLRTICDRGLKVLNLKINDEAKAFLLESANGDARMILNTLELATNLVIPAKAGIQIKHRHSELGSESVIDLQIIKDTLQSKLLYDRLGEEHFNTISAFIKSMRASNPDATLYYLARMIEAGEDPLFIARRMVVFASEDIGMAQPTALVIANDVFRACETIGYPECRENLAAGAVYLALSKKDRSAYDAFMKALDDVKHFGNLPIPMNIRNPVTKLMGEVGYGKNYQMYTKESLLPDKLKGKKYYVKK